jgi:hypothetical protein
MSIDELKAAIERRGYQVTMRSKYQGDDMPGQYFLTIVSGQRSMVRVVDVVELAHWKGDVGYLAESLLRDMSKGQHHVMCAHCKLPLLFEEAYVPGVRLAYGVPLEIVNNDHMEKHYRLVISGPEAKYHTNCPGCGVALADNMREIED